VPPTQLRPEIPADFEQVILRCLAKKPDDRYPDVKALGKALATCATATEWNAEKAEEWWAETSRSSTSIAVASLAQN
jgi:eukaryotic-like serine/threonine-protein kinase